MATSAFFFTVRVQSDFANGHNGIFPETPVECRCRLPVKKPCTFKRANGFYSCDESQLTNGVPEPRRDIYQRKPLTSA
jgi:hypothetical protein